MRFNNHFLDYRYTFLTHMFVTEYDYLVSRGVGSLLGAQDLISHVLYYFGDGQEVVS